MTGIFARIGIAAALWLFGAYLFVTNLTVNGNFLYMLCGWVFAIGAGWSLSLDIARVSKGNLN